MEFEFAFQMQYTPFKWNAQHISTLKITLQLIMCLCILFPKLSPHLLMFASDDRRSETVITPEEEDHLSGPGVCICNSNHNSITWRAESRTHLSKQTRPSTEHSRKASYVRGIPSRPDDQLRWVLIARSQV